MDESKAFVKALQGSVKGLRKAIYKRSPFTISISANWSVNCGFSPWLLRPKTVEMLPIASLLGHSVFKVGMRRLAGGNESHMQG